MATEREKRGKAEQGHGLRGEQCKYVGFWWPLLSKILILASKMPWWLSLSLFPLCNWAFLFSLSWSLGLQPDILPAWNTHSRFSVGTVMASYWGLRSQLITAEGPSLASSCHPHPFIPTPIAFVIILPLLDVSILGRVAWLSWQCCALYLVHTGYMSKFVVDQLLTLSSPKHLWLFLSIFSPITTLWAWIPHS